MTEDGYDIVAEGELALDEDRVSELASDHQTTLTQVGDRRLTEKIRFQLCLGGVERRSAKGPGRARFRLPFRALFLPSTGSTFHDAHLYIAADLRGDPTVEDVRPSDLPSAFVEEVESGLKGSLELAYSPVKAGLEGTGSRKRKEIPIVVRSGGMGSREADWEFDGSRVDGGLPTRVPLELDVSVDSTVLTLSVRMTAGVRWNGVPRWLPFVWPTGEFTRSLDIDLPTS